MKISDNQDLANQFVLKEISLEKFLEEHEKLKEKKLKNYNKTLEQYLIEKSHKEAFNNLCENLELER